jgi:phosphoglycolate phosphatase-like HAD superfamily hydrolase
MPQALDHLKAAVFDRDYTVLDATAASHRTISQLFRMAGGRPPDRLLVRAAWAMAADDTEFWRLLLRGSGARKSARWFQVQYRSLYPKFLHLARPYPDAAGLLRELRSTGIRLALVSALPSLSETKQALQRHGFDHFFDIIVTADVVSDRVDIYRADHFHRKLEVVKEALSRLQVKASDSLMVGDTSADVQVGRRLGMRTAAIIRTGAARAILEAQPDLYLTDLGGIIPLLRPAGHSETRGAGQNIE